jgi:hypothetical protein
LPIINARDDDVGNDKQPVDADKPPFGGFYISEKFRGIFIFLLGAALGLQSHYALLYSGFRWRWRWRLAIGILGWVLATFLIWHGTSILLGI